jgi:hypothetical protein
MPLERCRCRRRGRTLSAARASAPPHGRCPSLKRRQTKHKTVRQALLPQQQPDGSEHMPRQAVQSSSSSWGYIGAMPSALCIHASLQQERSLRQAQRQQYTARSE